MPGLPDLDDGERAAGGRWEVVKEEESTNPICLNLWPVRVCFFGLESETGTGEGMRFIFVSEKG